MGKVWAVFFTEEVHSGLRGRHKGRRWSVPRVRRSEVLILSVEEHLLCRGRARPSQEATDRQALAQSGKPRGGREDPRASPRVSSRPPANCLVLGAVSRDQGLLLERLPNAGAKRRRTIAQEGWPTGGAHAALREGGAGPSRPGRRGVSHSKDPGWRSREALPVHRHR